MESIVIHENTYGVRMIWRETKNTVTVTVRNDSLIFMRYRFPNINSPYNFPLCSWENLDCVNGWNYDEAYLETAVQKGKKPYVGISCFVRHNLDETPRIESILKELPVGITGGEEPARNNNFRSYFICLEGTLLDHFDLDAVFNHYELMGKKFSPTEKAEIVRLCNIELSVYGSKEAPYDYGNPKGTTQLVVTGLLLGYPLESTFSILSGY